MNWLRERRQEVGLTVQDDLVTQLQLEGVSVTRGAVSHWENDRNKPPLDNGEFRRALAKVLRLSEPELLRRAGYQTATVGRSEAAKIGADIIDDLPPDRQELAVRLLEQLRAS